MGFEEVVDMGEEVEYEVENMIEVEQKVFQLFVKQWEVEAKTI